MSQARWPVEVQPTDRMRRRARRRRRPASRHAHAQLTADRDRWSELMRRAAQLQVRQDQLRGDYLTTELFTAQALERSAAMLAGQRELAELKDARDRAWTTMLDAEERWRRQLAGALHDGVMGLLGSGVRSITWTQMDVEITDISVELGARVDDRDSEQLVTGACDLLLAHEPDWRVLFEPLGLPAEIMVDVDGLWEMASAGPR